jgi:hypothetical protein
MATRASAEQHEAGRSECWCCGNVDDSDRMIHLGNHPEVTLCVRCGYWASHQAREIEDRNRTGPVVATRNRLRGLRETVMQHGWHHHPVLGPPLRWLGKHLP